MNDISPPQNQMLTMLIVILHDTDRLPELLDAWKRVGVPGVTILQSAGGFHVENLVQRSGLGGLLKLFDPGKAQQRTLFALIDDPETLELAISEADRVVMGFDRPHSGIIFTIPIGRVLGLQKWGRTPIDSIDNGIERDSIDKNEANLMKWFQKDLQDIYGENVLADWTSQRKTKVSEIINVLTINTTIVRVDTPVNIILRELLTHTDTSTVCVVNSEDRLMGTINVSSLADVLMVPVIPEAFIKSSGMYDKALKYANINHTILASDLMNDPIYAVFDDELQKVFKILKDNNLTGLPVVDKFYRIKGYLSLLELLAICFPENI